MNITKNPEVAQEILGRLAEEYMEEREGMHATDLIYCLTRTYFKLTQGTQPTDEELLYFAIGWGLERVLLETKREPGQKDGIQYSPDFVTLKGGLAELKTTRLSSKKTEGPDYELPEGWLKQIMAYCYANGNEYELQEGYEEDYWTKKYVLVVYHIVGKWRPPDPKLVGLTLEFTQQELEENWATILARKEVLELSLEVNEVPTPFEFRLGEWECRNCRFKVLCEAITIQGRHEES